MHNMITNIQNFKGILESTGLPYIQVTDDNMAELLLLIWSHCNYEMEVLDRAPEEWLETNKEYAELYTAIYKKLSDVHSDMLKLNSLKPNNDNNN